MDEELQRMRDIGAGYRLNTPEVVERGMDAELARMRNIVCRSSVEAQEAHGRATALETQVHNVEASLRLSPRAYLNHPDVL